MAYRRALASGLQRLARHVAGSSVGAQIAMSAEAPATMRMGPSAVQIARSFAAQPAVAAETANVGKITQVR